MIRMDLFDKHPGVDMRPPASAHLMVASTDRYKTFLDNTLSPTTSANWNMNKQNYLLQGYFTRLAITQLNFEWKIPTIVPFKNDIFSMDISGNNALITFGVAIPSGFYNGTDLANTIETLIQNHVDYDPLSLFNVTYANGQFVFDVAPNYEISFIPQDDDDWNEINRLYQTLGINENNVEFLETQESSPAQMVYSRWYDITSTRLTQFQRVKDNSTLPYGRNADIIARVYASPPNVQVNPSSTSAPNFSTPWVMTIDYNTPKHIKWDTNQTITNFDIQVYDEFGELMYWSPLWNTEYNFTFMASET